MIERVLADPDSLDAGNTLGFRRENVSMDDVAHLLIVAQDLCTVASFRLAARQKSRLAFLVEQAAELLAERARRCRGRGGESSALPEA